MPNGAESGRKNRKQKYFTVESANRTLPLVRSIVTDIVEKFRELHDLHARLEVLQGSRRDALSTAHREEVEEVERDFERKKGELKTVVDELQGLGVHLKGPEGLVDFPATIDGREVFLCWKLGEPEVLYWHELDAGFQGRQQLTADLTIGSPERTDNE
jgi:hypothetical protein